MKKLTSIQKRRVEECIRIAHEHLREACETAGVTMSISLYNKEDFDSIGLFMHDKNGDECLICTIDWIQNVDGCMDHLEWESTGRTD